VPCELVITVDSSSIDTPIVGLVTEDVFHHGQLIIPAGTEVHGKAQVDHSRERIASDGRWTLVWQTGEELSVSGVALDRDATTDAGSWDITDGSAGLRGRVIKSDDMAEIKLYVAALLSGAAGAFTQTQSTPYGSFALPTLQNAPMAGAQSVLQSYAQQVQQTIERDGFYVRVPAGKQFYLYITQTIDEANAKIGGSLAHDVPSSERVSKPANVDPLPSEPVSVPAPMAPLRTYPYSFTQNYHTP
jgi:Bacterial conjugation TrbI-like protein